MTDSAIDAQFESSGNPVDRLRQQTTDALLQQQYQPRVHERIVVGNVEANNSFTFQVSAKPASQFGAVGLLHDEDDLSPFDLVRGHLHIGVGRDAGRICLDPGLGRKDLFSGWAT